ncbi:Na+/H+ antiporter subunit E [Saccharopolyspora cebuensis]|uniref:Na+/H+ antiporter subunit E n=1 Tax=Saccharopolyspora cebuensis TaxID=418759 RepID=A0ABV4CDB0_9PSEU
MTGTALRIAGLTAVYLLTLTSLHPADVVVGAALSTALVAIGARARAAVRTRAAPASTPGRRPPPPLTRRLAGVPALVGGTLVDVVRGTWLTVGYCLTGRTQRSGLVAVPIDPSTTGSATAWAIRVGIAPDTVVVDVELDPGADDGHRGRMLLHVLDASAPDRVRAEVQDSYERRQREVFP